MLPIVVPLPPPIIWVGATVLAIIGGLLLLSLLRQVACTNHPARRRDTRLRRRAGISPRQHTDTAHKRDRKRRAAG